MSLEAIATTSVTWLWEHYGKALADKTLNKAYEQWARFRWKEAEARYRTRVHQLYSTTRLLGHPKAITIDDIFTDVYVLDRLTAFRQYDLKQLQSRPLTRDGFSLEEKRRPALRLALKERRLYLLGKPGAGKTTFLKYLAIQACIGKLDKTPVFVSLKEWADSSMDITSYLIRQFEICAFPDAQDFIAQLLEHGDALVLFDGLDEVNQEGNQRADMIRDLTEFAKQYPETQICLTCRIAATDYSFDSFTYMEIADFNDRQIRQFVSKWYHDEQDKLRRFLTEFDRTEYRGLRELARTPLLLAMLCLAYDDSMSFPVRLVDLYKEAIDALLKRWDASRGIRRDEVYRKLSSVRKEQLLARLGAMNFEAGTYFVRRETIASQITDYLRSLPISDVGDVVPDGDSVLRAIEAQHGIITERAHDIYSFSHLTFQEYFTARHVIENAGDMAISKLLQSHLPDDRWREVFLYTSSLLGNADLFFEVFLKAAAELLKGDKLCAWLVDLAQTRVAKSRQPGPSGRAIFLFIALDLVRTHARPRNYNDPARDRAISLARDVALDLARMLARDRDMDLARAFTRARVQGVELALAEKDRKWILTMEQAMLLTNYLRANQLLVECLGLAAVSDRERIEMQLILPAKG